MQKFKINEENAQKEWGYKANINNTKKLVKEMVLDFANIQNRNFELKKKK